MDFITRGNISEQFESIDEQNQSIKTGFKEPAGSNVFVFESKLHQARLEIRFGHAIIWILTSKLTSASWKQTEITETGHGLYSS